MPPYVRMIAPACALSFAACLAFAQEKAPPNRLRRSDSITVIADIPKEQIRNEDDCDSKIQLGREALKNGDFPKAESYFEKALSMTEEYDYLADRRPTLLRSLGTTYLSQSRTLEAVNAFKRLLDLRTSDCKSDAEYPANCAEAQVDLATATAILGDLPSSLLLLKSAIERYQKQQKLDYLDVEKYVHQIREAEATVYQAAMLRKAGELQIARTTIANAKQSLQAILGVNDLDNGVRELAEKILALASTVSDQIR